MSLTVKARPIWERKAWRSISEPSGRVCKKSAARLASNQATSASSTDRTKFRLSCCSLARCCSLSAMVRLHWVGVKIGERDSRPARCTSPGLPCAPLSADRFNCRRIGPRSKFLHCRARDDLVELVALARRDCGDRSLRRQVTGRLGAESGSATGDQHNLTFNCFAHDEPSRTPSPMSRSPPPKITTCPKGVQPQFPNGIVSSVSFVSTTNTARSLAGFVLLALALTPWRSPGSSEKLCPAL